MLSRFVITVAALTAVAGPAFAAYTQAPEQRAAGSWTVLQNASDRVCYATNRKAGPSESQVGQIFGSQQAAQAAINSIATCNDNLQNSDSY